MAIRCVPHLRSPIPLCPLRSLFAVTRVVRTQRHRRDPNSVTSPNTPPRRTQQSSVCADVIEAPDRAVCKVTQSPTGLGRIRRLGVMPVVMPASATDASWHLAEWEDGWNSARWWIFNTPWLRLSALEQTRSDDVDFNFLAALHTKPRRQDKQWQNACGNASLMQQQY